jgi:hypothetical protein
MTDYNSKTMISATKLQAASRAGKIGGLIHPRNGQLFDFCDAFLFLLFDI